MLYYKKLLTDLVGETSIGIAAKALNTTKNSIHQWTKYDVEPRLEALTEMARHFRIPRPLLLIDLDNPDELLEIVRFIKIEFPDSITGPGVQPN